MYASLSIDKTVVSVTCTIPIMCNFFKKTGLFLLREGKGSTLTNIHLNKKNVSTDTVAPAIA